MTESTGGVFISTEKIYEELLRMNNHLNEIRSDIRAQGGKAEELKDSLKEHAERIRVLETTKKDRIHPSLVAVAISAPISILGVVAPFFFK